MTRWIILYKSYFSLVTYLRGLIQVGNCCSHESRYSVQRWVRPWFQPRKELELRQIDPGLSTAAMDIAKPKYQR